ncbi:hypothetical protein SteCoe_15736 [Stentor coeruleus]|uniref:EF-hand domain-containing protein n=1 Tax=Stentor coeruleus TaxID=5963 RepID=A0A1R2C2W4_9CILI|nr:hypothetical protein SteCoe_15736 [Stentor coeruleus]
MAVTSLSANSLKEILFNLQMQLKNKGLSSGKQLLKNFLDADTDKSGFLSREEFESLLNKSGIFLSRMDVTYLMRHFDRNKDGKISFNEFYDTLVPELRPRSQSFVNQIWEYLSQGANAVTISHIYSSFKASNHPQVASGHKTEQEILNRFLEVFDATRKGPDGIVTEEDFRKAQREISAAYPIDENAFIRMLECVWGVIEGRQCGNNEIQNVEIMVKEKIRLKMSPTETEEKALLRVFKFIDLDGNGWVTPVEFIEVMRRIGVNLRDEQIRAFFTKFDTDGSGTLDYSEFSRAVGNINSHLFTKSTTHAFFS